MLYGKHFMAGKGYIQIEGAVNIGSPNIQRISKTRSIINARLRRAMSSFQ